MDNNDKEYISGFAFNTAIEIENIIKSKTNNLVDENKYLQAMILEFRNKILLNGGLSDFTILDKYDKHFKIEKL